ncbi:hypothetical protein BGW37DRAFT_516961 [Umbelopsis sp. PMI_123]|nr:hypothetical protein BGW37DRAFT_516961 [Umbelopsis sp. PMI_123]
MSITAIKHRNQGSGKKLTNAFSKLNISRRPSSIQIEQHSVSTTSPTSSQSTVACTEPACAKRRVSFSEAPPKVHYFDRADHEEDWFIFDARLEDERNCPWKYYCKEEKKGFKGALKSMFGMSSKKCITEEDEEWEEYQPSNLWRHDTTTWEPSGGIAAIQEQDMLLSVRDDSSSIDFDMGDFANSDELTHSYQDVAMEVESERAAPSVLPLRTFMDIDISWTSIYPALIGLDDDDELVSANAVQVVAENSSHGAESIQQTDSDTDEGTDKDPNG